MFFKGFSICRWFYYLVIKFLFSIGFFKDSLDIKYNREIESVFRRLGDIYRGLS